MLDDTLDLQALRVFRAAVREGSFAGAARVMRLPKSTVSKRIRDLETGLNLRLIERTTRQMRVTAEGEVLAARADRLLGEADDILRALSDTGGVPRGHLRIAAPQLFGALFLGGIGATCRARHPDITLEFVMMDRSPDLLEEGFDAAIRIGPLPDSSEVALQLGRSRLMLVASPALPGIDRLHHPDGLHDLPLVGFSPVWPGGWTFRKGAQTASIQPRPGLTLTAPLAIRQAVLAGAGVALLPTYLATGPVAARQLVHLLPDWEGPEKSFFFTYPSPQSVTARLRAFAEVLRTELRRMDAEMTRSMGEVVPF